MGKIKTQFSEPMVRVSQFSIFNFQLSICGLFLCLLFSTSIYSQTQETETEKVDTSKIIKLDYPESLAELLSQFENKVVFVDFIASWCSGCIKGLKDYEKLDAFFDENDIVKLFVVVDTPRNMDKCYVYFDANNIKGYSVPYYLGDSDKKSSFREELADLFFKDDNNLTLIALPRFAIVDKEGNIVEKNAENPGKTEELKAQLEKYL